MTEADEDLLFSVTILIVGSKMPGHISHEIVGRLVS